MNHLTSADHRPSRATAPLSALARCVAMLLVTAWISGCAYRVTIQQGNFLEEDSIDQVQIGMTRNQVRFVLGTPLVADTFHEHRWDYVYYLKQGKSRRIETRHFVVFFEGDNVLTTERRDAT